MNQRTFFKASFFLIISSFLLLVAPGFGQDRVGVEGGDIRVHASRDVTPVVVRSSDATMLRLLETAFTVHGGYTIVNSMNDAAYAVRVDPVGGAGARLTLTSGVPEQALFAETQPGRSLRAAGLKAIDRAIMKTSGKPGFFSGKLAFLGKETGSSEVYTSDFLFGNVLKWTGDNKNALRPRWSPDGNYIVYTSYKSGYPDIHRLDLRGNRRDVIVKYEGTNMGARYSPNGNRMAMVVSGKGNADLWVREAGGRDRNLTRSSGLEAAPSWSPTGDRIVFSSDQNGGVQLFVIPSHGGTMKRLPTNISRYCAEPDWNPTDANKIAFTIAQGRGYQIAVYDMSTGKSETVTSESGDAIEAQWLNDGRHIIYTHRRANNRQVKIVDTVTQRSYVLSGSKTSVSQASFLAPQ